METVNARLRLVAALVTGALALGAAACSGAGDGPESEDGPGAAAHSGSAKEHARATVERLYAAMAEQDAAGVCAELAQDVKRQMLEGGSAPTAFAACEDTFQGLLTQGQGAGAASGSDQDAWTVSVDGDRAIATRARPRGQQDYVRLTRVEDGWKAVTIGSRPTR